MNPEPKKKKQPPRAILMGVGLDTDGHKRITTGDNFALIGGTKETHQTMVEKTIKIKEKLAERGKQLETISREEFDEIARSIGLRQYQPKNN